MIQTWIADVTPLLGEETYRTYYGQLPPWRKEKADRMRFQKDQALSVGAWILYRRMRECYGVSEEGAYNLSHSGRYALCALETGTDMETGVRLGCDVEMIGEFRPKVAKRFFCPSEEAYILEQESPELRAEAFYRYWVLKESFIKAVREGMKLDLRSFEISLEEGGARLIRQPKEYSEKYYYREYRASAGDARIAVCSTDPDFGELASADIFA